MQVRTTNSSAGKTYQKGESESEKLEARWEFLKYHLSKDIPINSLYELGTLLAMPQSTPEGLQQQQMLAKTYELIAGMWK